VSGAAAPIRRELEAAMSDATQGRVEPIIEPRRDEPRRDEPRRETAMPSAHEPFASAPAVRPALDQLARIEEKSARMEEKYARAEAIMLRLEQKVETATGVTGVLARQDDLNALSKRVGRLPGFGALIVAAIVGAIMAAVLVVFAQHLNIARYIPALL
jgi:hypothetical protein